MRRIAILMSLAALLGPCVTGCGPTADSGDQPDYEVAVVMLPEGDAEAGKAAFVQLGCAACHQVAWDEDLPAPTSPAPGPELGVNALQPGTGGLAGAITAPAHRVPEAFRKADDTSPMPEYAEVMTLRQLADIVVYLRRQGMETRARSTPSF